MKGCVELIVVYLKLAFREKSVLFFNYVFPLIFFFMFGHFVGARGGAMSQVVAMVLVIGVLGNGLFGAGIRTVAERESNILRRYKVAPITPAPLLVASMVTGWLLFLPTIFMIFGLAHFAYDMPLPERMGSLIAFISLGALAMRAVGLIIASVVNSVAESNVLVQSLYMPMLFLSGATFPIAMLPLWAQLLSQFLPPSYLFSGVQGIVLRSETLVQNAVPALAMLLATFVGMFLSMKLFRWEKDEKISGKAKLWVLVVFIPFIALGVQQAYTRENIAKNKTYDRTMRRGQIRLIRGAQILRRDGQLQQAAVLLKNGKIEQVYPGAGPDPKSVKADIVEASGKTLLPGLVDVHVHLAVTGGVASDRKDAEPRENIGRGLAAYLYTGIGAVRSTGDPMDAIEEWKRSIVSGEKLGAEVFTTGPLFTTAGGHGTEYIRDIPAQFREAAAKQLLRTPKAASEAAEQVRELAKSGVSGIKVILESGTAGVLFNRLDTGILRAIVAEARKQNLPVACHTGDARDVADALDAGVTSIEHGSARELIPPELFVRMAKDGIYYVPTLSVIEAIQHISEGKTDLLSRFLIAQVVPGTLIESTRKALASPELQQRRSRIASLGVDIQKARENLLRAYKAGARLATGSDAGNLLVMHGPTVHRELQLWVSAGIPANVALQAATFNGASLLKIDKRVGAIESGYEATALLVDGNPVQEIGAIERIDTVFFKGERINRADLLDQK